MSKLKTNNSKFFTSAWKFLAIYGVWFAMFSGLEEVLAGKMWKVLGSLLLSLIIIRVFKLRSNE